jgi:hypothetical protein
MGYPNAKKENTHLLPFWLGDSARMLDINLSLRFQGISGYGGWGR